MPDFITLKDVSELTSIDIQKLYDFIAGGVLQATKVGRQYLVSRKSYQLFKKDLESGADFGNQDKIRIYAIRHNRTK